MVYPAIFTPYEDNSGGYVVTFPDLPGCVTGGDTIEEALYMAEDAASGWILDELEQGNVIPKASSIDSIVIEEGFLNIIHLDIEAYSEKYGKKFIRKNLTIPAWLNTFAEKNNINFSKVLQDTLLNIARQQNL